MSGDMFGSTTRPEPPDPNRWIAGWIAKRGDHEMVRVQFLDLIRAKGGAIYEYLVETDSEAAGIAVRRKWPTEATPAGDRKRAESDWGDPDVIRQAVRKIEFLPDGHRAPLDDVKRWLGVLRGLVGRFAPHNLAYVPDPTTVADVVPIDRGATAPVQPRRAAAAPIPPTRSPAAATGENRPSPVPAKTLAPEHLAAYRQATGINAPVTPRPSGPKPFVPRPANDPHPPPQPSAGGPFPWS